MTARVDTSSAILPPTSGIRRFLRVAILSFLCGLLLFQQIEKLQAQSVNRQVPTPHAAPDGKPTDGARPSGTTQSAENDEFGRGVVRAMRRTMPSIRTTGRVTIRLFLDEQGKLHKIRVIKTEGDPRLEKVLLNATKGTSFPVPPVGSTVADRTFLVHYIYK